jgi:peptide/nickel transport system substrate-binding protein
MNSLKLPPMLALLRILLLLPWIFIPVSQRIGFAQESGPTDFLRLKNLSGARGGSIVLALGADPSSFNRMMATGLPGITITDRLSADLVHINRSSMELEPALATHWEQDKSGRIYTIHLRRGVRFSDGSPFTADDVMFTFQALTDPRVACPLAGQIEVEGAFPSIKKMDDLTLQLSFPRPIGMGLRMLDSVPMMPKRLLNKSVQEGRFAEIWGPTANPADIVGLGPFRLSEYQRGIKIVLERNPYYWKKDGLGQTLPYLDTLTFLIIPDLNSEALRFQQGELDMMGSPSLSPENYATLRRAQKKLKLRDLGPGITMDYLWFNLNRGANRIGKIHIDPEKLAIFERPEFRLAISHALDRDGMVRSILLGLGSPQYGPVSSGNAQWYYSGITPTRYNPARSRELLAQIGLKDSNRDGILEYGKMQRPLEISLFTSRGNSIREKAAQIIRDNLSKIGIRLAIQTFLPNEIASRFLSSFDYESILFGFTGTDVTPDLQTNLWYSSGNIHFWQPNQEKPERAWEASIDSLISKLVRSITPSDRKTGFDQAQDIWAKNMPAIPTFAPNVLVGWSNSLGNIRPSILVPHLVWNAEEITKLKP